jgi:hypothetical protein
VSPKKKPAPSPSTEPAGAGLACGCRVTFRTGVEGSPVTVVLAEKAPGCPATIHVAGLPLFDHREALRPSTRPLPATQSDYEEN